MTPTAEPEPQLIDLREFFGVARRRKWSIAVVTLVVAGLAVFMVARRAPLYSSTASVEVRPLSAGVELQGYYYDAFVNMDTEAQRVTSEPVARLAAATLGVPATTPEEVDSVLAGVSVSVSTDTTFLDITCTDGVAGAAQTCAQAFADAYVQDRVESAQAAYDGAREGPLQQIKDADKQIREFSAALASASETDRQLLLEELDGAKADRDAARLQLMQIPTPSPTPAIIARSADLPSAPSNKDYVSTGVLAVLLGLALGVGLAFVRERLDEHVGSREGLEAAIAAPVLSVVPTVPGWRKVSETRLVALDSPDGVAAEAYRTARTGILYQAREGELRVLEIAGPGQDEGKTTTTVNLAVSLAQAGKNVIAVSCDLRKPRLHRFFGFENELGLTNVLKGEAALKDALIATPLPNLRVLASGPVPSNPAELLSSPAMDELLRRLREHFDFVLLDTPPALVVADALSLAPMSDGIVIVADASKTTRAAISHLRHQLNRVGGVVIGGVLNNFDPAHARRYPGYYGSYSYGSRYRSGETAVPAAVVAPVVERVVERHAPMAQPLEPPEPLEPNGQGEAEAAVEPARAQDVEDWR